MEGDHQLLDESVATVWAVRLRDGTEAVAKLHSPIVGERFLVAVQAVQRQVAAAGFPAPQPLLAPQRAGDRLVTVESFLGDGVTPDGHDPELRAVMAAGLAGLVEIAEPVADLAGNPWREDPRGAGRLVAGHTDWRSQNMRFDDGRLSAVYDWESLDLVPEPELAGGVAATFTADWTHGMASFPSAEESAAFVADYQRARGRPFTAGERERAAAATRWRAAYVRSHIARHREQQM